MKFDLATLTRRVRNPRRKVIVLREIAPVRVAATDLFRSSYLPLIEAWRKGTEQLLITYERTLAAMTTDSPADVRADIDGIASLIDRLLFVLTPRLREWAVRTEAWHREKWRGAVLSAAGVDLLTLIGPDDVAETVETIIERNVGLIRSVSDQARDRISDVVFRGLTNRTPARDVAKEISEATGAARARAQRIAADQLTKLTSALDRERRRQAGLDVWKWRHSGKLHARPAHQARNGNLYGDEPAMVGREVDGQAVLEPPPADDLPGVPPFCGCRQQAVLVFD